MTDLRDTREQVHARTVIPARDTHLDQARASRIAGAVNALLNEYPDVEYATIRIHASTEADILSRDERLPGGIRIVASGMRGTLTGTAGDPGELEHVYACCHQLEGRPHTDYCPVWAQCESTHPSAPHIRCRKRPGHAIDHESPNGRNWPNVISGLVMEGHSGRWHQTGDDEAHPVEQCDSDCLR